MVPRERIELSASPLPRVRSTTELPRLSVSARAIGRTPSIVKQCLRIQTMLSLRYLSVQAVLSLRYLSTERYTAKRLRDGK